MPWQITKDVKWTSSLKMHISKNKNQERKKPKSIPKATQQVHTIKEFSKKLFLTVHWCKIEDLQRHHQDDKISALSKLLN